MNTHPKRGLGDMTRHLCRECGGQNTFAMNLVSWRRSGKPAENWERCACEDCGAYWRLPTNGEQLGNLVMTERNPFLPIDASPRLRALAEDYYVRNLDTYKYGRTALQQDAAIYAEFVARGTPEPPPPILLN